MLALAEPSGLDLAGPAGRGGSLTMLVLQLGDPSAQGIELRQLRLDFAIGMLKNQ